MQASAELVRIFHQSNTSPKRKRGRDNRLPSLALRANAAHFVPDNLRMVRNAG